jgi:DNA-binding response OmpR family regulator
MSAKNVNTKIMRKRILIVDDDIAILESLKLLLEDAGYLVEACCDGGFISKKFNGSKPDLILLDYLLPGENGADIAKRLKDKDETKNIPVIIISASYNIKDQIFNSGADDFIPKPYDINHLLGTLEKHLVKAI